MKSYFTYPCSFNGIECNKTDRNPKFCGNESMLNLLNRHLDSVVLEESDRTLYVVHGRTYILPSFTDDELNTEVWKQIVGYSNYYISNLGRVYSVSSDRILRPALSPCHEQNKHKPFVTILSDKCDSTGKCKRTMFGLYSLVRDYFIIPNLDNATGGRITYKNGNKHDCRLSNLIFTPFQSTNKSNDLNLDKDDVSLFICIRTSVMDNLLEDIVVDNKIDCSIVYKEDKFVIVSCVGDGYDLFEYLSNSFKNDIPLFPCNDDYESDLDNIRIQVNAIYQHFMNREN